MTTLKLGSSMRVIPMGGGVSISHGTLRARDLLRIFAKALAERKPNETVELRDRAYKYADWIDSNTQTLDDYDDEAGEIISDLAERLNELAPEGYYFGAHEGDGSDFGFWRNEE